MQPYVTAQDNAQGGALGFECTRSVTAARTAIRRTPTDQEVMVWLNDRLALFPPGTTPDARTVSALAKFEADLATLLQDAGIARVLKGADVMLPALAQDRSIQERATLVMPRRAIERLALPSQFLLRNKQRAAALDKLSPVLLLLFRKPDSASAAMSIA